MGSVYITRVICTLPDFRTLPVIIYILTAMSLQGMNSTDTYSQRRQVNENNINSNKVKSKVYNWSSLKLI